MQQMNAYEMVTKYETFKMTKIFTQSQPKMATLTVCGISSIKLQQGENV